VLQALAVLGGESLSSELREQVIEDTLPGAPEAKRAWTERGMIQDVTAGLDAVRLPVTVVRRRLRSGRARGCAQGYFRPLSSADKLSGAAGHRASFSAGSTGCPG